MRFAWGATGDVWFASPPGKQACHLRFPSVGNLCFFRAVGEANIVSESKREARDFASRLGRPAPEAANSKALTQKW